MDPTTDRAFATIMPAMNTVIAATPPGRIEGVREGDVCVWRGIRYAKAPVGPLRFRAPQPVDKWEGTINAHSFGNVSLQPPSVLNKITSPLNEDCLNLNIFSTFREGEKLPVMVFIHGGAYINGAGSVPAYDGKKLAREGVVVVTINYRLGVLGYLYAKGLPGCDAEFDSNIGLRDQIAALRWVNDNVLAFGGDPGCVTIFGESAGANAVVTLMAVPSAAGLFHRAIVQSLPMSTTLTIQQATEIAQLYCQKIGVDSDPISLKTTPGEAFISSAYEFTAWIASTKRPGTMAFNPVVDSDVLPLEPIVALRAGSGRNVPLLIGSNLHESEIFIKRNYPLVTYNSDLIDLLFNLHPHIDRNRILSAYPGFPSRQACLNFASDMMFTIPTLWVADAQKLHTPNVYVYRFDYSPTLGGLIGLGATHASELPLVFGTFDLAPYTFLYSLSFGAHLPLSKRICKAWTDFAKSGDPKVVGWKRFEDTERCVSVWDSPEDKILSDPYKRVRDAWGDNKFYTS
ncbi:putative carboxylesterase [Cladochytrium replicatum]|nr:putative carboxylesterase [Cladochytrium replicatum]